MGRYEWFAAVSLYFILDDFSEPRPKPRSIGYCIVLDETRDQLGQPEGRYFGVSPMRYAIPMLRVVP